MKLEEYMADPPGVFIRHELDQREWSQRDLAYILGMAEAQLSRILSGTHAITPDMAKQLGDAFDVPPEFFANLQKLYDLSRAKEPDPAIKKRAALQGAVPLREMIRRGWIADGAPSLLALQVSRFFESADLDTVFATGFAAKRTNYEQDTPSQFAWLFRVRQLARLQSVARFSTDALADAIVRLKPLMIDVDAIKEVPAILAKSGVRLVFVEVLPNAKIDGVCTWLSDSEPVVGMSLRQDRLDNFWFVLRHELEHVMRGDGKERAVIDDFDDDDHKSGNLPPEELAANSAAANFCVREERMSSFIERKFPYISERDVLSFSAVSEVHPAIVVGQIQKRLDRYNFLRKYLVQVRKHLPETAVIDGWGSPISANL